MRESVDARITLRLKKRLKHGYTKLSELKPNSREVAKRLLELGEIYTDENGFLRLAVE